MSTIKFENVGSPQMVMRLIGGAFMLRKGDVVELTEMQSEHSSVRCAVAAGDLVRVDSSTTKAKPAPAEKPVEVVAIEEDKVEAKPVKATKASEPTKSATTEK